MDPQAFLIKRQTISMMVQCTLCQGLCNSSLSVQSLRAKAEAGDRAAALELAEDDELFRQHMRPDEQLKQNRAKIRRVDPTVNLAADTFDRFSEGATARDTSRVRYKGSTTV